MLFDGCLLFSFQIETCQEETGCAAPNAGELSKSRREAVSIEVGHLFSPCFRLNVDTIHVTAEIQSRRCRTYPVVSAASCARWPIREIPPDKHQLTTGILREKAGQFTAKFQKWHHCARDSNFLRKTGRFFIRRVQPLGQPRSSLPAYDGSDERPDSADNQQNQPGKPGGQTIRGR